MKKETIVNLLGHSIDCGDCFQVKNSLDTFIYGWLEYYDITVITQVSNGAVYEISDFIQAFQFYKPEQSEEQEEYYGVKIVRL